MTPSSRPGRSRYSILAGAVLTMASSVCLAGCASGSPAASPSTRPANKTTCPEVQLTSGLPPLDRRLVPYGPTLLGVESMFGDEIQTVNLISGGYLDDHFEAYDDIETTGTTTLRNSEVLLLVSSLQGRPIRAAVWREDAEPPCDAHAIIATGMSEDEFLIHLNSLE